MDYDTLRESSKHLKGAVSFAKQFSSLVAREVDDQGEREEKGEPGVEPDSKPWDVTGELLQAIGIAGMINVQIAMKSWAKRSGITRPLHFRYNFLLCTSCSCFLLCTFCGVLTEISISLFFYFSSESRRLGERVRRSSSVLSPLARATLSNTKGKMLSSEARATIKMRAVRAAAAGDVTKRKKFLKSISFFQNFTEETLDGIAKSLEYG